MACIQVPDDGKGQVSCHFGASDALLPMYEVEVRSCSHHETLITRFKLRFPSRKQRLSYPLYEGVSRSRPSNAVAVDNSASLRPETLGLAASFRANFASASLLGSFMDPGSDSRAFLRPSVILESSKPPSVKFLPCGPLGSLRYWSTMYPGAVAPLPLDVFSERPDRMPALDEVFSGRASRLPENLPPSL